MEDGLWAAFFGYIVGNGDLTVVAWSLCSENKVNLNGDQSNIARHRYNPPKAKLDLRKLNLSLEKCSSQDVIDQLAIGLKDLCRMAMLDFETRVAALKNRLWAPQFSWPGSSTSDEEVCASDKSL